MRLGPALLTVCLAGASFSTMAFAEGADIGAGLYADSCAACHGATGHGDGDMSGVMTIKAPDITKLAARNDGAFPMLKVIHVIDGRTGVRAHGGQMPVFGRAFSAGTDGYEGVIETRGRILSLAMYLESIQE